MIATGTAMPPRDGAEQARLSESDRGKFFGAADFCLLYLVSLVSLARELEWIAHESQLFGVVLRGFFVFAGAAATAVAIAPLLLFPRKEWKALFPDFALLVYFSGLTLGASAQWWSGGWALVALFPWVLYSPRRK